MGEKDPNRLKYILIYLGWGLLAMIVISLLFLLYAIIGWGV